MTYLGSGRAGAAGLALLLAGTAQAQQAAQPSPDAPAPEQITVVGTTPLPGSGIDRDKIAGNPVSLRTGELTRGGVASGTRALDESSGSVNLDQAVGNTLQPNLLFRGFEASPLAGDAQGLAVYVNGTRFNSSFADTTNWDLILDQAISKIDVVDASPAFGLNALGGAVAVQLKDGFRDPGGELEASGGSFGRIQLTGSYGAHNDAWSGYVAATGLNENGWRDHSPSQTRQGYADLGWRRADAEVHLGVLGAVNTLTGNGTTPVEQLAADRAAIFTYPDTTRNHSLRAILTGTATLSPTLSVQASAYYSYLDQQTLNGDAGDQLVCDDDASLVCEDDGATRLTDRGGNPIANTITNSPYATQYGFDQYAAGGPYSVLNVTSTRSNSYGASAQLTSTRQIAGHDNHLVVGAGYDGGTSDFAAYTLLGGLGLDRGYLASPNIEIDQADLSITPVAVHTTNDYYGVFATDTLDLTPTLFATVSARFNDAQVALQDRIGTALDGRHSFNRINPGAGLSWRIVPALTAYAGYSEANRAPTPSELSCASAEAPCSLTNFFVGDPDLKQVVAHSIEAGLRARLAVAGGKLTGHAGYFRTDNDDDIQFVTSATLGRAYFRNVGQTRRQGAELSADYRRGWLRTYASYTYTDATFRTALLLNNDSNPNADANGVYAVQPGDRLPGIPRSVLKFGVQADATARWNLGITGRYASGQVLFGDEGNQSPTTGSYVVFNFNTRYQLTRSLQLFGSIENMFGARYATYGTFAPTGDVPIVQVPGATNPRALTPGAPVAGYAGVRATF